VVDRLKEAGLLIPCHDLEYLKPSVSQDFFQVSAVLAVLSRNFQYYDNIVNLARFAIYTRELYSDITDLIEAGYSNNVKSVPQWRY